MKARELIRLLRSAGAEPVPGTRGSGDHQVMRFPDGSKVAVPKGGRQTEASDGCMARARRAMRAWAMKRDGAEAGR